MEAKHSKREKHLAECSSDPQELVAIKKKTDSVGEALGYSLATLKSSMFVNSAATTCPPG